MTDLRTRLAVFRDGRTPLAAPEISITTGKPKTDLGLGLLVERRFDAPVERTSAVKSENGFEERHLMDPKVIRKLEELGLSGLDISISLSPSGKILVKDPDGNLCCILKRTDDGIEATTFVTPYIIREKSNRIATTAGLSPSF